MMKTTQRCLLMFMLLLSSMSGWAQGTYALVTDASSLKDGDQIVIVSREYSYYMTTIQNTNNREADLRGFDNDRTTITFSNNNVQIITLERKTDAWYFNTGSGYLYAASSSSNSLKTTRETTDDNAKATIVIGSDDNATITFLGKNTHNMLQYYNGKNKLFSCYLSTSPQKPVQIFKKVDGVTLDENADNSQTITDNNGKVANVTLTRTFTARNGWYTLCLPFALTRAQIESAFGSDVVVQTYSSATIQDNHVNINFTDYTSNLAAGQSCLIKIPTKTVTNPIFNGVTINSSATTTSSYSYGNDGEFQVVGIYSPTAIISSTSNVMKYRFVNNQGTGLAYPSDGGASKLKGTRVYFILPTAVQAKQAVLVTGDDGSTGIREVSNGQKSKNQYVYDLQGKRLGDGSAQSIQRLPKGIYVMNGKKVVIK
jgi:hypothetical protein